MKNEQLIQSANALLEAMPHVSKTEVERQLGMPKNSLSGFLSGKKPIPKKWVVALEGYILKNMGADEPKDPNDLKPDDKLTMILPSDEGAASATDNFRAIDAVVDTIGTTDINDMIKKELAEDGIAQKLRTTQSDKLISDIVYKAADTTIDNDNDFEKKVEEMAKHFGNNLIEETEEGIKAIEKFKDATLSPYCLDNIKPDPPKHFIPSNQPKTDKFGFFTKDADTPQNAPQTKQWVLDIEEYCKIEGCAPNDLISAHKRCVIMERGDEPKPDFLKPPTTTPKNIYQNPKPPTNFGF